MSNEREDNRRRVEQASAMGPPVPGSPSSGSLIHGELILALENDLLAPLVAVVNNMEVHTESTSEDQRSALCASTKLAAERLHQTVLHLTDLARLEVGSTAGEGEPVSLSSVITESLLSFRHTAPDSSHDVTLDSNASDVVLVVDRERLFRMLVSLLSAVAAELKPDARIRIRSRYVSHGGKRASVSVAYCFNPSCARSRLWHRTFELPEIGVADNARAALFAHYSRSVAIHFRGSVRVDKERGRVVFEADFPVVRIGRGRDTPRAEGGSRISIAVLCDSHPLVAGFYDRLSSVDINYRQFPTVSALSDAMTEDWPSAVILRHSRAGSDVISFARTIRALEYGRTIPILLVSRGINYENLQVCRRYVNAVLLDPFSSEQLRRYVIGITRPDRRRSFRPLELHDGA